MAKLCPKLEDLRLTLCGQLSTESLVTMAKTLTQLSRIELLGPFLVREGGWSALITETGCNLKGFLITQSPRFDLANMELLAEKCPNLSELRLSEVGLLNDDFLESISRLQKLTLLELSSPSTSLTDEGITTLLPQIGTSLLSLDLSDNPDLTDLALLSIAEHCPRLESLILRNLVELTDEGVAAFFTALTAKGHPGFEEINLEKGHDLNDSSLRALIEHSGGTVEKLSLLGWKDISTAALSTLGRCSRLRELNLGWCRKVTDFTVKEVLESCNSIELIKVWGEYLLASDCRA